MTNLPPHLQERIEQEARHTSLAPRYETGFLAGASFLYALLKEETGEVEVWRKVTDNRKAPDDWFGPIRYDRISEWEYDVGYGHEVNNYDGNELLEWLDTETPVVAGCGELVEALEWYADPGNYLDENGNLATAWKNNEAIARKATSALKTFKR
jgi:hypothetical protein